MFFTPFLKAFTCFCLTLSFASEGQAQQSNAWYQKYTPTYYYYQQPAQYYQHSGYNYNYGSYYQTPAATQSVATPGTDETRKVKKTATKRKSSGSVAERPRNDQRWMTDWNDAWARAVKEGRPLVTIFVHHGCPECDKLDATLARQDAQHLLDSAVKARVEFTENAEIVHRFGVKLTPTFLVFSPAHNGEVYREVGALSLERLQTLKPSIDGLVTDPRPEPAAKKREKARMDTDSDDLATSRSVASL